MKIKITRTFEKAAKKLHRREITAAEDEIDKIAKNPAIGEIKKGDLASVYVHKFRLNNQLTLLAYLYDATENEMTLLSLGSHENFYRDLKKKI